MQLSSSRRVLIENVLSLAALQGINYLTPLITLPYLARILQPATFGLLTYAQSIIIYFDLFTDFGFNFSSTRAISISRHDPQAVARVFWSTLVTKFLLMLASGIILLGLIACIPDLRRIGTLLAANFLYVIGTTLFPIWYFQGLERIKVAAICSGIGRLLTVPALLLFVHSPSNYLIAAGTQASVEVTASLLALPYIRRYFPVRLYWPKWSDIRATIREAWPLFISASALQVSASSTIVIVGSASSVLEVGYFSAADKIIRTATAILNPIGVALYPRISAVKQLSSRAAFVLIRKTLGVMAIVGMAASTLIFFAGPPFCNLLLGGAFHRSAIVLQILSPLPFLYGLMSVLGTQTMLTCGMDALFSRTLLIAVALSIPVTFWFASHSGAIGAAISADLLSLGIVVTLVLILLAKRMPVWKHGLAESGRRSYDCI